MTNHAIIGQAFSILREQLAPYVVQKIMQIPDYKGNDLWWTEGIMSMLSDRERSDLYYGDDFAQRTQPDCARIRSVPHSPWRGTAGREHCNVQ